jgi:hypothetical protein
MGLKMVTPVTDYYLLKYDKNLTIMASRIFGEDIVESAYVSKITHTGVTGSNLEREIVGLKEQGFDTVQDEIDNSGKDIVITFKNGSSVEFTNSEWGGIASSDISSAVMIE